MSDLTDAQRLQLQEDEYRLPTHWLLRKHGVIHYARKTALMAEMVRAAKVSSGNALDIGCGDGRGTYDLAQALGPAITIRGVDFSARAIAFARLMAEKMTFDVQNGGRLPFPDGSFDLVVAREVIEHIPPADLHAFLVESARVLKPGACALFTTPSVKRKLAPKHFQHFTPELLRSELAGAGYAVESLRGFGWWPAPWFENTHRKLLSLPMLWRLHAWLGTSEEPLGRADCLLALARKPNSGTR